MFNNWLKIIVKHNMSNDENIPSSLIFTKYIFIIIVFDKQVIKIKSCEIC
jgi:hypothetical protein